MYKNILFDVDGTLIDTEKPIIHSLQKVLKEELNIKKSYNDLLFVLGVPGKYSLEKLNIPKDKLDYILNKWSHTISLNQSKMRLFDDIEYVLQNLYNNKINLAIITSKNDEEMKNEFSPFNIDKYFSSIVTASDTKLHKPNPDPILKAMDNLNITNKEKTIYIGDSIYDMKSAKAAGIAFGLAKWGTPTPNAFKNLDHSFNKPTDILKLIK
ncbi:HAD family hydrolase [Miniphocaeibacter halophilus]|uniref:HAD family hydrolase n=1 Tax=Miniphocaeibacter halophilus TaxID=2931922 RepID=A0AC61MU26_9FIRM|nr:HAD family hydrolase [Miniphocaeibacter halophilus]QQK08893.1 HAD family hydrolase [Miniphocaeibacter halophilus]